MMNLTEAALIVIDVQEGIDDPRMGIRNNPGAEANIAALIARWRFTKQPIFHVKHCSVEPESPLRPELPGNEIKPEAAPVEGEKLYSKTENSAFIGTSLEADLKVENINALVMVGLTTDHCVSTSVRMAENLGFAVVLAGDATATHDRVGPDGVHYSADEMHRINLASLHGEFCEVMATADILEQVSR